MKYLNKEFFFGVGTKNYLKACNELKITSDREIIKEKVVYCYTHPHQFYYEFISEHGVLGTIIILSLILSLFLQIKAKLLIKKSSVNFLYSKFILLFHYSQ